MSAPIILASGSPVRARLLVQAGVPHEVVVPRVDESALRDSLLADGAPHRSIADALAEMKALRIAEKRPGPLVLGADQVLTCEGELFAKPADRDAARAQLAALRGRSHQLITAVVAAEDGRAVWRHVETVTLHMRPVTDAYLDAYLDIAWPDVAGCVGCYKLEAQGIRLFTRIDGDFMSALGLPLLSVLSYLVTRGMVAP